MPVRRSSFASPLMSRTHSPEYRYPADLETFFGRGSAGQTAPANAASANDRVRAHKPGLRMSHN